MQVLPSSIDWNRIYENNHLATNETKLRSFQIRLNIRSIVTNVQRNGMGIVDNKHCVFCSEDPETIIHLFCKCKLVDDFWQDFSDWLSTKLCHDFYLENRHKLFRFEDCDGIFQLVNRLLLYARFLIYRCKYSKSLLNMAQYFSLLNSVKKSECKPIIAKKKNKLALRFGKRNQLH